jgi:hypothetical protein
MSPDGRYSTLYSCSSQPTLESTGWNGHSFVNLRNNCPNSPVEVYYSIKESCVAEFLDGSLRRAYSSERNRLEMWKHEERNCEGESSLYGRSEGEVCIPTPFGSLFLTQKLNL